MNGLHLLEEATDIHIGDFDSSANTIPIILYIFCSLDAVFI